MHVWQVEKKYDKRTDPNVASPYVSHCSAAKGGFEQYIALPPRIPQVQGFQCPSPSDDKETFALYMLLLFFPLKCEGKKRCCKDQDVFGPFHAYGTLSFASVWERFFASILRKADKASKILDERKQTCSLGTLFDWPDLYFASITRTVVVNATIIAMAKKKFKKWQRHFPCKITKKKSHSKMTSIFWCF